MKKFSKPSEVFLFERSGSVRLSVVHHSKIHKDIYFFFTAPFDVLLQNVGLNSHDQILVSHLNEGPKWLLGHSQKDGELRLIEDLKLLDGSEYFGANTFKHSSLPVTMSFKFADDAKKTFSASNTVAIAGSFLSLILGFLFYNLIIQSRRTSILLLITA